MMQIVGRTVDGRPVIGGVFFAVTTLGVPLDMLLDLFGSRGVVPDWDGFYRDAGLEGWPHDAILRRVREAVSDVWGDRAADHVTGALDRAYGRTHEEEMR